MENGFGANDNHGNTGLFAPTLQNEFVASTATVTPNSPIDALQRTPCFLDKL